MERHGTQGAVRLPLHGQPPSFSAGLKIGKNPRVIAPTVCGAVSVVDVLLVVCDCGAGEGRGLAFGLRWALLSRFVVGGVPSCVRMLIGCRWVAGDD